MIETAFQIVSIAAVVTGLVGAVALTVQVIKSIGEDAAPRVSEEALLREHRRRVASEKDFEKFAMDVSKKISEMEKVLNDLHNQGEHK